jgi:peptide/nickel transport system permease protein
LNSSLTPVQQAWKKFKRNKTALAGLFLIILTVLAAVLGYLIMPDSTPNANRMTLQLSIKKPGTEVMMLCLPKSEPVDTLNFLQKMLFGQPAFDQQVPITGYHFKGDSIYVNQYISEEDQPEVKAYALTEITGYTESNNKSYQSLQTQIKQQQIITHIYWLGTDIYGRDLLSRLILGARVSLAVGLMAVVISLLLGITIGALAGYYGGWLDSALSWVMNILWALPALLLVIALSFALSKGLWQIFIAVGLSMWVEVARLVRGQVIGLKQAEYIEAAQALGYDDFRIVTRHILPNITGPVLVLASSNFAAAILLEAGLSFLGFGAQPPMPTWGGMIKEHYGYIIMDAAYLAVLPGLAIMLMVYAFNMVTVGLRDAFDVKSQSVRI